MNSDDAKLILKHSKIPKHIIDFKVDELSQRKKWLEITKNAANTLHKAGVLCLVGYPKTGKTTMACVLMRSRVLQDGLSAYYTDAQGFCLDFEDRHHLREEVFDRYFRPCYLTLDDVEDREPNEKNSAWINHLVKKRINDSQCTILVCNVSPDYIPHVLPPSLIVLIESKNAFLNLDWEQFPDKKEEPTTKEASEPSEPEPTPEPPNPAA